MSYTVLHAAAFEDNYIWIIVPDTIQTSEPRPAIVVDPGDEIPVLEVIERANLKPVAILCTHHHWDHVDGASALAREFNIPVYGPAAEDIPVVTQPVNDGDTVSEPETGIQFQVLAVPGHTKGHVAYYGAEMLFCGDTLFSAGCGRLFEGTAEQMLSSLTRLASLPDSTQVYCGHEYTMANLRFAMTIEPHNDEIRQHINRIDSLRKNNLPSLPSTVAIEKDINPFLRSGRETVKNAAEKHHGMHLEDEVAVFAEIRRWKDHFRG